MVDNDICLECTAEDAYVSLQYNIPSSNSIRIRPRQSVVLFSFYDGFCYRYYLRRILDSLYITRNN